MNTKHLKKYLFKIILIFSLLVGDTGFSNSIQFKQVELSLALKSLCEQLHFNAYISPKIQGELTWTVSNAPPEKLLQDLLWIHHLHMKKLSNLVWILPEQELLEHASIQAKINKVLLETTPIFKKKYVIQFSDGKNLFEQIKQPQSGFLSARGRAWFFEATQQIEIEDDELHLNRILSFLSSQDHALPQIRIEARIASVDEDAEQALGIRWHAQSESTSDSDYLISKIPGLHGWGLDAKLSALEKKGHAELLSKPSLMTVNLKTAFIESGEEVPYQESSESGGTTQTFKKAVLGLQVTPKLLSGRKVMLVLLVSQDRPSHRLVQGVPVISTRKIQTQVIVRDGQTIALGGIYENQADQATENLPLIHHIPLLGHLFGMKRVERHKRELMIFITPHLM